MSEVRLNIGGRPYTIACGPGEEEHVAGLGALLQEKLDQLGGALSVQESQNLLFAALYVADELVESRTKLEAAEKAREKAAAGEEEARSEAQEANTRLVDLQKRLEEAESEAAKLAGEAQELRANPAPAISADHHDELGLALERFAGLLEDCADKLEGKAQTS
ncbi:cell division protein ZapA [Qipengyuania sp. JC766]|uniref:cell division protein ZapA n=1 Tax=Qipengyuania sp. JC766 TaxID=3232139 RepID=UPI003459D73B